ncbi:ABC transporter substrate-binding protein [Xylophilus sp. GOD-11R]|uniref:ABC transporter substrate-binding protein n=1 Tax=Xylophilus sp. GOD-11R TaxID=3089814 RepID=UPI00298C51F2|nr:ABC transporter substrate-binding protein [Xylophilus sp. GOD-11R]WPB55440.1 ABC transporter substrate-binding protein [Xylophilus sp. GOD-11R]
MTSTTLRRLAAGIAAAGLACSLAAQPAGGKLSDGRVRFGVLTDMSGVYSDLAGPGSLLAAQMAVEDFGGKVLGAPVDIVSADHQNKTDLAANTARQWFDTQQVDAIVDLVSSPVSLAVMEIAKQKNKVAFVNGSGTSRVTNDSCNANTVHTSWDSYSQSYSLVDAMVKQGGDSWFFVTLDNAGGQSVERDGMAAVKAAGAKVVGNVRFPLNTADFSSFVLQAQASKAKVIGLIASGADTVNAVKAINEFGLTRQQKVVAMVTFLPEIHSLGLQAAQGLILNEAFYWDTDADTRKFSERFFAKSKKMPDAVHAGVYSSITHYLRAVQAAGTDDAAAVMKKMKETPVKDFYARGGSIREDGRMVFDMRLVQVKKPAESKKPWDYYDIVATIAADQAFQPLSKSTCTLVKK